MNKSALRPTFSIITLMLFALMSRAQCVTIYDTLSPTICAGDTFYFNGVAHTRSTIIGFGRTVSDTVSLGGGCDSITLLRLTVLRAVRDSFTQYICTGSSYTFGAQSLTATGVYRDTLVNGSVAGCDSTAIVNLIVGGAVTSTTAASICRGDSLLFGGAYVKTAGAYNDTVRSGGSCDSIVVLALTYYPTPVSTIVQPYCAGTPYIFNGVTLTTPGTYYDTIPGATSYGCDSIVRLQYEQTYVRALRRDTICYADTLYIPGGGIILGSSGSARYAPDTVAFGCVDTVYTFFITVDSPATPLISFAGAVLTETVAGFSSYQWQLGGADLTGSTLATDTPQVSGSYTVQASDARGCSAVSAPYTVTGVGINTISGGLRTNIYPNPNAGSFILETSGAVGGEAVIYDILGKVVGQATVTKDKMNIDLNMTEGLYLLKLKDNDGKVSSMTFTVSK